MVEQITGDEQDIDLSRDGARNDRLKAVVIEGLVGLALLWFAIAVTIQMHIGCVQDLEGASALVFHTNSLSAKCTWHIGRRESSGYLGVSGGNCLWDVTVCQAKESDMRLPVHDYLDALRIPY